MGKKKTTKLKIFHGPSHEVERQFNEWYKENNPRMFKVGPIEVAGLEKWSGDKQCHSQVCVAVSRWLQQHILGYDTAYPHCTDTSRYSILS